VRGDPVSSGTVVPVLRAANKKPPGRRHRRLRANAMWRSPSG